MIRNRDCILYPGKGTVQYLIAVLQGPSCTSPLDNLHHYSAAGDLATGHCIHCTRPRPASRPPCGCFPRMVSDCSCGLSLDAEERQVRSGAASSPAGRSPFRPDQWAERGARGFESGPLATGGRLGGGLEVDAQGRVWGRSSTSAGVSPGQGRCWESKGVCHFDCRRGEQAGASTTVASTRDALVLESGLRKSGSQLSYDCRFLLRRATIVGPKAPTHRPLCLSSRRPIHGGSDGGSPCLFPFAPLPWGPPVVPVATTGALIGHGGAYAQNVAEVGRHPRTLLQLPSTASCLCVLTRIESPRCVQAHRTDSAFMDSHQVSSGIGEMS